MATPTSAPGAPTVARRCTERLTGAISELLKLLIAFGGDVNAKAREGARTPLHYVASAGHAPAIELLLASGARINPTDRKLDTPLDEAYRSDQPTVVVVLLESRGGRRCETPH